MARKKKPAAKTVDDEQVVLVPPEDVPQVTNYDELADTADMMVSLEQYALLEARLAAAEELIQAQSDLLDAWALRKNRNRAMDKVFNARNTWVKLVNNG